MGQLVKRHYVREEEFLDDYATSAVVAARLLNGAWAPEYDCTDGLRHQRERLLSSGTLDTLVFAAAAVYQDGSVQIALRSTRRRVNLRVRTVADVLVAEVLMDWPMVAGV